MTDKTSKFIKLDEVVARTGLSSSSIDRQEKDGTFPLRRVLGVRNVGWLESDITKWIESRPVKASSTEGES